MQAHKMRDAAMKTKTMTEMTDQELLDILEESTKTQEKILAENARADAERGIKGAWVNGLPQKGNVSGTGNQAEDKHNARKAVRAQERETPQAKIVRVTLKWVRDNGFRNAVDDESVVALVTWTLQTEEDPKKAQQMVFKQLMELVDKKRRR
jgi:hypothetical protein